MENNLLMQILIYTKEMGGSDCHICTGSKPRVRINGNLQPIENMDILTPESIYNIVKDILSETQLQRLHKDRIVDFSFTVKDIGVLRANVFSQKGNFAMVLRLLPIDVPRFETLGIPNFILECTQKTKGLFLVTGATGSGKSTTLASLINIINENKQCHIITIEDPIEYIHNHKKGLVTQREIGLDADNFPFALRATLREDPDVILVGEMRDPETISTALTAAETGHLVFSTLHTIGAAKTIDRIVDAFPSGQQNQIKAQLATALGGIISQQLIPRADKPGRVVATEIMFTNSAIQNLIRENKQHQISSVIQTQAKSGMQLMEADLARLYKLGIISRESAETYAPDKTLMSKYISI